MFFLLMFITFFVVTEIEMGEGWVATLEMIKLQHERNYWPSGVENIFFEFFYLMLNLSLSG